MRRLSQGGFISAPAVIDDLFLSVDQYGERNRPSITSPFVAFAPG
jgi:hypothetical protein